MNLLKDFHQTWSSLQTQKINSLLEATSNSDLNIISLAKIIDNFFTSYDVELTLQWIPKIFTFIFNLNLTTCGCRV